MSLRTVSAWLQALVFGLLLTMCLVPPASASRNSSRCCMRRAREQFETLGVLPWEACAVNASHDPINPLITSSRGWCEQHCPGIETSSFGQWSDLLTTFLVPAIALLILCPTGSSGHADDDDDADDADDDGDEDEKKEEKEKEEQDGDGQVQEKGSKEGDQADQVSNGNECLDTEKRVDQDHATEVTVSKEIPDGRPGRQAKQKHSGRRTLFYLAQEYINILGDPSSALAGSFYQLYWDGKHVRKLCAIFREPQQNAAAGDAIRFALISSQTHMEKINPEPSSPGVTQRDLPSPGMTEDDMHELSSLVKKAILVETTIPDLVLLNPERTDGTTSRPEAARTLSTDTGECMCFESIESVLNTEPKPDLHEAYRRSKLRSRLDGVIRMLLKAKINFVNGVVVPTILTYGGCASGFYAAYNVLGDRDKAHSLAFGVGFAWLLVLAVVSNSYAITVNGGLLESALVTLLHGASPRCQNRHHRNRHTHRVFSPRVVPFRKRIPTTRMWSQWIELVKAKDWLETTDGGRQGSLASRKMDVRFLFKFLACQTAGWVVVAVPVMSAMVISYFTPTIGIGCHSFTFILYAALALIVAWLLVVRTFVEPSGTLGIALRRVYGLLTFFNAFVIVGGAAFNLTGVYRNCRCNRLFGNKDDLVVLSTNTQLDRDNAEKTWLAAGYIAFTFAWLLSAAAIGMREYIYVRLARRFLPMDEPQVAKPFSWSLRLTHVVNRKPI